MHVRDLSEFAYLMSLVGMVGCLVLVALVIGTPGLLIRLILLVAGLLLSIGLLLILPWNCLSILIFGQMVAERISLLLVFLKLLVLVFIYLLQNLLLRVRFGERQKSMVMLVWSVAVLCACSRGHADCSAC